MIPRAIAMIFRETEALKELGWQYAMTGQFVEIYNEKVCRQLSHLAFILIPFLSL